MPLAKDIRELKPGRVFREDDEATLYWVRAGQVYYRHYPIKGADPATFRFYRGSFGKDAQNCYCTKKRLAGGHGESYRALNYAYATDGRSVWTLGGQVKGAEAKSFQVCDDGVLDEDGVRLPHGYAKDRSRVFFYDYDGKPVWVRKASSDSFISLNDGHFGKDSEFVFCRGAVLPGARVASWKKVGRGYSKGDRRVFLWNREIKGADAETFVAVKAGDWQLAMDKARQYWNERPVSPADFKKLLKG